MKKTNKRLPLNKEIVRSLVTSALRAAAGGDDPNKVQLSFSHCAAYACPSDGAAMGDGGCGGNL